MPPPLTPTELEILAIESLWWRFSGAKEQAIRERTDMSETGYYLALNSLIDTEQALAHSPHMVKRLRAVRNARQRTRSARALGLVG